MLHLSRLRLVRWVTMTIWSMALGERDFMTHPLLLMMMMRWALIRNHAHPSILSIILFLGGRWHWYCPSCWKSILYFWSTQRHTKGWWCNDFMILKIALLLLHFLVIKIYCRCLMFCLSVRRSVRLHQDRMNTTSASGPTCSTLLLGSTPLPMVSSKTIVVTSLLPYLVSGKLVRV